MLWVTANANVALVKYWGKASGPLQRSGPGHVESGWAGKAKEAADALPVGEECNAADGPPPPAGRRERSPQRIARSGAASGSLSLTLAGLETAAGVRFDPGLQADRVAWDRPGPTDKILRFLEDFRRETGIRHRAEVFLAANFPVAAGLASSASTFAALATAACRAAGLEPTTGDLARIARLGSGSAGRSIPGGWVEWRSAGDGGEILPVAPAGHWPLSVLVAVTEEGPKEVGSREGMARTAGTSPYYRAWLDESSRDLARVRRAVLERDFELLARVAERNCLLMHAAAMGSEPPLLYWKPGTLAVVHEVRRLRARGVRVFFTIDAGPQVKVFCEPGAVPVVGTALADLPGVLRLIRSGPGEGPRLLAGPPEWLDEPAREVAAP